MSSTSPAPKVITIPDSDSDDELSEPEEGFDFGANVIGTANLAINGDISPAKEGAEGSDGDDDDDENAWETESLLEDAVEEMTTVSFEPHEDACTPEEAQELKGLLRKYGEKKLLEEAIVNRNMTIRKLLTAFGVRPPSFLEGAEDKAFLSLLHVVMARELSRRTKLPHVNTVEDVVKLLREAKNIIVLTGAGISTSLGIPDFRSKGSGLYSRLENLGLSDPQEVFDIDVFTDDPTIFYSIAKDILPDNKRFSPTHAFIALLQEKGKLLTQYTQNIDNLEILAGIEPERLIQCHGSFATATCVKCKYKVPGEKIYPDLRASRVAKCDMCLKTLTDNSITGKKRKRSKSSDKAKKKRYSEDSSAEEEEMNFREAGVMKPDITFFGEQLPDTFHKRLVNNDKDKCDLLICIGTSLKVAPVSEIIGFLPADIPQVYISKTPVHHIEFDVQLLGSCDEVVVELCRRAGWKFEHEMIPKDAAKMDIQSLGGWPPRYAFTSEIEGANASASK